MEVTQQHSQPSLDKNLIADRIRRWGGSASIALLDPACQVFGTKNIQGNIGYRIESGCVIVFGDPVCSPSDVSPLVQAFHHYCNNLGKNIIYVTVSKKFTQWALHHTCQASMEIGSELIIDPFEDPRYGADGHLIRKKVNHSQREGVVIQEKLKEDQKLENDIQGVMNTWLKARSGPQIFLSHVKLFDNQRAQRWFYAKKNNLLVGALLLNQVEARQGWMVTLLMQTPQAPNGTSELLIIKAMEALRQEGCHFLTFGVTPSQTIGEMTGFSPFSHYLAKSAYSLAKKIFRLEGKRKYWEKFKPQSEESYLLFSKPHIGLREIWSVIRAFNATL